MATLKNSTASTLIALSVGIEDQNAVRKVISPVSKTPETQDKLLFRESNLNADGIEAAINIAAIGQTESQNLDKTALQFGAKELNSLLNAATLFNHKLKASQEILNTPEPSPRKTR